MQMLTFSRGMLRSTFATANRLTSVFAKKNFAICTTNCRSFSKTYCNCRHKMKRIISSPKSFAKAAPSIHYLFRRFPSTLAEPKGMSSDNFDNASATPNSTSSTTFNPEEGKKFERMASSWWDPEGQMKELHSMNKLRVRLVRDGLLTDSKVMSSPTPLKGLKILDVGCGGGILSEPLGRLGASVLGLDPGQENIKVAELHLQQSPDLCENVKYQCSTIEKFVEQHQNLLFDGVVSSETIEHVENPETFVRLMAQCLKPQGSLFLTTLNRTFESWAGAIIAWEYILRRLPIGTHQWNKFLTPQEVQVMLNSNGLRTKLIHGMCYNPLLNKWTWSSSTSINYCIHAVKDS